MKTNRLIQSLAITAITISLNLSASAGGFVDFLRAATAGLEDVSHDINERYGAPIALATALFAEGQCEQQTDGSLFFDSRKFQDSPTLLRTVLDFWKPGWRNQDSLVRLQAELEMGNFLTLPVGNIASMKIGTRTIYVQRLQGGETIVTIRVN